jgi:hypothetical protein
MKDFRRWYHQNQVKPLISKGVENYKKALSKTKGFYEDVDVEKEGIDNDLTDNILLKNEKIQKIDLALKSIMSADSETATSA